jgi:hypothetical protein
MESKRNQSRHKLSIASHSVMFAQGNAGTVREIIQEALSEQLRELLAPKPYDLFGGIHPFQQG